MLKEKGVRSCLSILILSDVSALPAAAAATTVATDGRIGNGGTTAEKTGNGGTAAEKTGNAVNVTIVSVINNVWSCFGSS